MSFSFLRAIFVVLLAAVLAMPLVGCDDPVDCLPVGPPSRAEYFTISAAQAAEIGATDAGPGGGSSCTAACYSMLGYGVVVDACSVDGPADGGVTLTCVFAGPFHCG